MGILSFIYLFIHSFSSKRSFILCHRELKNWLTDIPEGSQDAVDKCRHSECSIDSNDKKSWIISMTITAWVLHEYKLFFRLGSGLHLRNMVTSMWTVAARALWKGRTVTL
jgi:hypothetical protein